MFKQNVDHYITTGPASDMEKCPICQAAYPSNLKPTLIYINKGSVGFAFTCPNDHYCQVNFSNPWLEYACNRDGDQLTK